MHIAYQVDNAGRTDIILSQNVLLPHKSGVAMYNCSIAEAYVTFHEWSNFPIAYKVDFLLAQKSGVVMYNYRIAEAYVTL